MARKHVITSEALAQLRLDDIRTVTFYKHDELTTDLICCEIEGEGGTNFFHEEMEGWDGLLRRLEELPGFDRDWYAQVYLPAFEPCTTVAYRR